MHKKGQTTGNILRISGGVCIAIGGVFATLNKIQIAGGFIAIGGVLIWVAQVI